MATHDSSLKRQRQNEKRGIQNQAFRSTIKTFIKKVRQAAKKEEAASSLKEVTRLFHKATHKGILHPRNANRHISRLSQFVNRLGA